MNATVCDHFGRSDDNRQADEQRRQVQRPREYSRCHDGDDKQQARQAITEVVKRERGTEGARWADRTCHSKQHDRIGVDRRKRCQSDDETEHCPNDCANPQCAPRDH
jgi:hypothetical protein